MKMEPKRVRALAKRYGITAESIKNWAKMETEEWPAPWDDPLGLVRWYESRKGRHPKAAFIARCQALAAGEVEEVSGDGSADSDAEPIPEPAVSEGGSVAAPVGEREFSKGDVVAILQRLGLSETLGRILEEERRSYQRMMKAREEGQAGLESAERQAWLKITENKRAIHKTPDAVETAVGLVKDWARREQEERFRDLRRLMGARQLGSAFQAAVMERGEDWEDAWDRELDLCLAKWVEGMPD